MRHRYRAGVGIDLEHDHAVHDHHQKIACDTLALWCLRGVEQRLFKPLDVWQAQCAAWVTEEAQPAGHSIHEEQPGITAEALRNFMR